ncbi:D-alanyl-D-alanine carboxypeptidase family protein [Numidum massiliense]|uniref:D-alanyl-D-alanine carboxypeptidase family protein n=1 Tax=Numidum massiliense TaxID=1522315 RepID=UPI0006D5B081|nr:D-alanyl-D-alanine carboxypeptidase family protein [Numidum massiliense]
MKTSKAKVSKRSIRCILFLAAVFVVLNGWIFYTKGLSIHAKAAILIDAQSGKILFKHNSDEPLPPASMSKMMTEYIVLEKIGDGAIGWDDPVTISRAAAYKEGAKIDIHPGDTLTVRDLYSAVVVASANNAAVALAEHIAGSEEAFTQLMNAKAKALGLSLKTTFINATGLDENGTSSLMTAEDVARLAKRLLDDYPEVLDTAHLAQYALNFDGSVLASTNRMLAAGDPNVRFDGVDGLKTGFIDSAGYCFAGTAKRGEQRLISVVMGTPGDRERFVETKKLLSLGFGEKQLPSFPSLREMVAGFSW